jgi:hypothetical protein
MRWKKVMDAFFFAFCGQRWAQRFDETDAKFQRCKQPLATHPLTYFPSYY